MSISHTGRYQVLGPNDGSSYWQPKPANGFVRTLLNKASTGASTPFSAGTQTIDPGCYVREHCHDAHEEILYITEGQGIAHIDGERHAMAPGVCLFLGKNRSHRFDNTGAGPLSFFWVLMPGGLDEFFEKIGRPREHGDVAPAPFERPDNVAAIEAATVFGTLRKKDE